MKLLSCAALLALGSLAFGARAGDVVERTYSLDVVVSADGSVKSAQAREGAPPSVASFLESRVGSWKFQPGNVDGEPAETETTVSVRLQARPSSDDPERAEVAVIEAATGASSLTTTTPRYPPGVARRGIEGAVVVAVDIDGEGAVLDARPFEHAPRVDRTLQRAVLDSMADWTFTPERVAGEGMPATVVVPVCFTMHRMGSRGPVDVQTPPCEYSLTGEPEGEMRTLSVTLDPAARLLSDPTAEPTAD